jgi:2-keto-4-pentenoate hydratase
MKVKTDIKAGQVIVGGSFNYVAGQNSGGNNNVNIGAIG